VLRTARRILGRLAAEGGHVRRGHSSSFPLAVLDVNDESPTFFPAIYNVSLPENVARDFKVVRLNCTDADVGLNAELSYFITGTAADPISLSRGAFHPDNIFPDCLAGGSGCIFQGCFPLWPSAQGAGTPSGKGTAFGTRCQRDERELESRLHIGAADPKTCAVSPSAARPRSGSPLGSRWTGIWEPLALGTPCH